MQVDKDYWLGTYEPELQAALREFIQPGMVTYDIGANIGYVSLLMAKAADVDELPTYQWKTPLQRCVQILKRHRDVMFADHPAAKPISVIITTLAASAYAGETNIDEAMRNILTNIENLVSLIT
jgi:hypothetical protein